MGSAPKKGNGQQKESSLIYRSLELGPWLTTWITFSSAECPRLVGVQACRTAGASSRPEWIAFSGATATYLKVQEDEEEAEEEEDNNDKKEEDQKYFCFQWSNCNLPQGAGGWGGGRGQ